MTKAISSRLLILLWLASANAMAGLQLDNQREAFAAAEKAAARGDLSEYQRLKHNLKDYPLYPHLLYSELVKRGSKVSEQELEAFLSQYADSPLADRLRDSWLSRFATAGNWHAYKRFYAPTKSVELQCHYLHALMATGHLAEMMDGVPALWLSGSSQPSACNDVFTAWRAAGGLTPELTWGRIELAMADKNGFSLASYLGRYLPQQDKPLLELWLKVHQNPSLVANGLERQHPIARKILVHGVERLIKTVGVDQALAQWRRIRPTHPFSDQEIAQVERRIALQMLWDDNGQALAFLVAMKPSHRDEKLLDTGVREAVGLRDWNPLVRLVEQTPAAERNEYQRYWLGRALEHLGRQDEARELLAELAKERTYHGFLAADRVASDYNLRHVSLALPPDLLAAVEAKPAVQRARELFALRRMVDARREWYKLTQAMNQPELQAFSKLAQGWGWHSRAIFTLAKTDYWDDLELRFPLEHRRHLDPIAGGRNLDISWVFAVVRQESAFITDARSPSGALGLMQLMPATAREVAGKLRISAPQTADILRPELNITLGTSYLRQMLDRLDQHPILATAAYNAGPNRVLRWLPEQHVAADEWVATIPFDETRSYVERVMAYTVIYDTRLGLTPRRLVDSMMHPIGKQKGNAVTATEQPPPKAG